MTNRLMLVAALMASTGCSALFMEKLPKTYDVRTQQPHCTATKGFVAWDGLNAAAWGVTAIALAVSSGNTDEPVRGETASDYTGLAIGAALVGISHIISGVSGNRWADDCRDAIAAQPAIERRPTVTAPAVVVAAPPRGFFCASAGDVGLCTRERSACETGQAALAMTVADVSACTLVETAWCFRGRCFPAEAACVVQRDKAGDEDPCVETR